MTTPIVVLVAIGLSQTIWDTMKQYFELTILSPLRLLMPSFANRFANELYTTIEYWTTLLGTNPTEGTKPFKTRYHCEVPGSMRGLYLLIRVSQVRDLYGLQAWKIFPEGEF